MQDHSPVSEPLCEETDESLGARVLSKVSWRLFPFMMLLYIINYLDRINVSFAGPSMMLSLGFNDSMFGLGSGLFFVGYFLFGVPSNHMLVKLGARRWIATITVLWGLVSMSMSLVHNQSMFFIIRFLLGVAEAGFFPGMILYLTYWFPKRDHAKAVARFMTAIPIAGVLGGIVSSRILLMHGVLGLPGWKWLFIITGVPAVIAGFVVLAVLTDGPAQCKWLSDMERKWLIDKIASEQKVAIHESPLAKSDSEKSNSENPEKPIPDKSTPEKKENVFADLRVWHLAILYFCLTLGMYGFQLWLPQIIMSFGKLDDATAALLSAIPAVFQALGMIFVAAHSDKKSERRWHVALSAGLASVCLFLCGFCHNPVIALVCLSITAFGIWGTVGPFWAIPTSYLRTSSAAAGIGMINSIGNTGGFAGTYVVGFLRSLNPDFIYSLGALAVSLAVAALLALATKPKANQSTPTQDPT